VLVLGFVQNEEGAAAVHRTDGKSWAKPATMFSMLLA
jgi:hypothetical protein